MNINNDYLSTIQQRAQAVFQALADVEPTDALAILNAAKGMVEAIANHESDLIRKDALADREAMRQLMSVALSQVGFIQLGDKSMHEVPQTSETRRLPEYPKPTSRIVGRRSEGPQPDWMQDELAKLDEDKK